MSLRRRLALLTIGAFLGGLTVLCFAVPSLVESFLTDRLDEELERASGLTARLVASDFTALEQGFPANANAENDTSTSVLDEVYAEIRDIDGTLVRGEFVDPSLGDRSIPDLPVVLDADVQEPFTVTGVGGETPEQWRVQVFNLFSDAAEASGSLVVAVPMTSVDDTTSQVVRIALFTSAATLVVVGALAWWLIGLGLRPLKKMERSAAAIADADDLGRRVDHPAPETEIGQLGLTLNHMLQRLELSFNAQRASEKRLRQFAADASHELRTPLTSIRGYAELYRHGANLPAQVARSMTRIEEEAVRMNRLVEDLLLLARFDKGVTVANEEIDLAAAVGDLVDDLRAVEPNRAITLTVTPAIVVGDRHRIAQAVSNLLTNACVHTPAGTRIDVAVAAKEQRCPVVAEVAVADHGVGLPAEKIKRVFDRFYRADQSRSRPDGYAGSGLGLSITEAIVRSHGGCVAVSATPGGGATFKIRLPLAGSGRE